MGPHIASRSQVVYNGSSQLLGDRDEKYAARCRGCQYMPIDPSMLPPQHNLPRTPIGQPERAR